MRGYVNPDLMDDRVRLAAKEPFTYRKRSRTTLLVLHDSHTPPSVQRPVEHLRWQGRQRGLLEIGYHLIIGRDGVSHLLRPIDSLGSHAPGFNHLSIGLCLIGGRDEDRDVPSDNFTPIQRAVLLKYCAGFLTEFPEAQVCGHSEIQKWKRKGSSRTAHTCPALDVNAVRLEAMSFKFPDNRTRTLSEMVASVTHSTGRKLRVTNANAEQAQTEAEPQ